jgi:hypothetical protein
MNEIERLMEEIAAWLFEYGDESAVLKFGIWSFEDSPHTYYATVSGDNGLLLGEDSYGSDTIEAALRAVVNSLAQHDAAQTAIEIERHPAYLRR